MATHFKYDKRFSFFILSVVIIGAASLFAVNRAGFAYGMAVLTVGALLGLFAYNRQGRKEQVIPSDAAPPVHTEVATAVIFITGPWAEKWFDRQSASAAHRADHHITWLLAPSVPELHRRLESVSADPPPHISLFFPFLPDGHANEAIMLSRLTAWKNAFLSLKQQPPLRCTLAIYARLSHERLAHDPDSAIWSGELDLGQDKMQNLPASFDTLLRQLEAADSGTCCYRTQRSAMTSLLFLWLTQRALTPCLQSIFTASDSLRLNRVLVADHSYGFSRHGAWSAWLAENYGVLPGLASPQRKLPLPPFTLPQPEKPLTTASPSCHSRGLLATCITTLLLSFMLILAAEKQSEFLQKVNIEQRDVSELASASAAQKINTILRLNKNRRLLLQCQEEYLVDKLLLSPCKKRLIRMNKLIADYYHALFSQTVLHFSAGRAVLQTETQQVLAVLLPMFSQNPEMRFVITGHSDNTGMPDMNKALSLQRALAVRDWIMENSALPVTRFMVEGAADTRPVASNLTEEGRRLNRRVEIRPLPEPS